MLEVKSGASDNVVTFEEVTIVGLKIQEVALFRELLLELEAIVEASFTVLAAIMAIGLQGILRVKEGANVDI